MNSGSRTYSMANRAAKAASNRERIRQAAVALYREKPEEFSVKAVAAAAQTTVQTVLRLFGSKAALIVMANEAGATERRRSARSPDEIAAAVRRLYDDYEKRGETIGPPGEAERAAQRHWIALNLLPPPIARTPQADPVLLFGLIVATDISTWNLLRRELGLYRRAAEAVTVDMIAALTGR